MTKYYRVRTQEQWDWLMKYFEKQNKGIQWFFGQLPTDLNTYDIYKSKTIIQKDDKDKLLYSGLTHYEQDENVHSFIEVSDLMEDEKMENKNIANSTESLMPTSNKKIKDDGCVTISYSDLEKIKTSSGDAAFEGVEMVDESTKYGLKHVVDEIHIPKSLVQQKVKMTKAEKKEFDKLKDEMSLDRHDLDDLLTRIKDSEDFPLLYHRLYVADGNGVESQLEFARAWADPSLIEVTPEKKWNVKIPPFSRTNKYYNKDGGELGGVDSDYNDEEDQQFTADELKEYGLDDDMYEKVEVTDDGTK